MGDTIGFPLAARVAVGNLAPVAAAIAARLLNALTMGVYHAAPAARTEGQAGPLEVDASGNLRVVEAVAPQYEDNTAGVAWMHTRPTASATNPISVDVSAALEAATVSKASPGRFYRARGRVDKSIGTADRWILVMNASSVPGDGAVTILTSIKIPHVTGTDSFFDIDIPQGLYASTGIVVGASLTEFTKTESGVGNCMSLTVLYA